MVKRRPGRPRLRPVGPAHQGIRKPKASSTSSSAGAAAADGSTPPNKSRTKHGGSSGRRVIKPLQVPIGSMTANSSKVSVSASASASASASTSVSASFSPSTSRSTGPGFYSPTSPWVRPLIDTTNSTLRSHEAKYSQCLLDFQFSSCRSSVFVQAPASDIERQASIARRLGRLITYLHHGPCSSWKWKFLSKKLEPM